jgi:hypothetical protein
MFVHSENLHLWVGEVLCLENKVALLLQVKQAVRHRGFKPAACFDIWLATFHIIEMLYDTPFLEAPRTDHTPEKAERNTEIIARYEAGETGASIAQVFGISERRVSQILHSQGK